MVAGAVHDDGPRRLPTDKLFTDLDRFASTPLGALTILVVTVMLKAFLPDAIKIARTKANKKKKASHGA